MTPTRQGSIHLFRLLGIDVYLHWSWFVVALYSISTRIHDYTSPIWGVWEYLALFLIVLLHELGHSLACRSVGGKADQIVLWPLGGVAYVDPPSRPGATLWSIAAGPLVNLVLAPVLLGLLFFGRAAGWRTEHADLYIFVRTVGLNINLGLLCFNILPIYPLDGGQILRSLLWYGLGKARSLMVATLVGFIGGIGLIGLAVFLESLWIGVLAAFLLSICWRSFAHARVLLKVEKLPRRPQFVCPTCRSSPPIGNFWRCQQCGQPFDLFASSAVCPHCSATQELAACPDCGSVKPFHAWDTTIRET